MKRCLVLLSLFFTWHSLAAGNLESLEAELESLNMPSNQIPDVVEKEKIYSVQTRYAPLKYRSEVTLGGMRNFTANGYLSANEVSLAYRFHFNDRWNLGLAGHYGFTSLSSTGVTLFEQAGVFPDVAYAKYRGDFTVGYNVFYGKFRFSMDQVFYFDQYVEVGAGIVQLNTGRVPAGVIDVGFAFWMGKSASVRLGLKNYLLNEKGVVNSGFADHLLAHIDVGFLFGG